MQASRQTERFASEALFPGWRGRKPFRQRMKRVAAKLYREQPGLREAVERVPFEPFEAADAVTTPVRNYHFLPEPAKACLDAVPETLRAPWLCALLLWHMERFPEAFERSGLHGEFALHYADSFHRLLDQIEEDTAFADMASDSFRKDLWLARLVMIPAFAQVWWPHSGIAARTLFLSHIAAVVRLFTQCGGRRPMLEGHTHDPVARAYWNEAGWREALRLAALALPALPAARGVFGTAWFYDPAIVSVTPRLAYVQQLQLGRGAFRLKVGSNPDAIANATRTSSDRRSRFEQGSYLPTDYSIVWSRAAIRAAYGPSD